MTRLFVLGLLLVILWLALKNFKLQFKVTFGQGSPRPAPPALRSETLVRCVRCGTFVAAPRALKGVGEEVFCSEGCRGAAPGASAPG
jgi:hypothetical protein